MGRKKKIKSFDDLAGEVSCGDTPYSVGRSLYKYTDCGPWTNFVLNEAGQAIHGKGSLYYEDKDSFDRKLVKHIIGVEVGSIVEGSDVEVGPRDLMFPFTMDEFNKLVESINNEADFYWKRDNTDLFSIEHDGANMGWISWTSFDDKPNWGDENDGYDPIPKKVKAAFVKWYTKGRWKDGSCSIIMDKPLDFGVKGWTVTQRYDDSTY